MPAAVPDDLTGKLVLVKQRGFGEWWPAYSNDPKCESATYMSDRVDKEYTDEVEESKDWPPTNDMIPCKALLRKWFQSVACSHKELMQRAWYREDAMPRQRRIDSSQRANVEKYLQHIREVCIEPNLAAAIAAVRFSVVTEDEEKNILI